MLTRLPLSLSSEWRSKVVTTLPPEYREHLEWTLVLRLACESPMRLVSLLRDAAGMSWHLCADPPSTAAELLLSFFLSDWEGSDEVQVNFAGGRITVEDAALKRDPRAHVDVKAPTAATTGAVVSLAGLAAHRLWVSAIALAEADTQRRRMHRWRVRPQLAAALPEQLASLASGAQAGFIPE